MISNADFLDKQMITILNIIALNLQESQVNLMQQSQEDG